MEHAADLKSLRLTLITYIVIFAMKIVVYFLTGIIALMAEAFHTLTDIFVSSFLLVAAVWSRKQADQVHMFGYGKAQNVAALVAATLFISFTSFTLYEQSIPRLFRTGAAAYHNLDLAIGVIVVSMLLAAVPLVTMLRQKTRGAAARAQMVELLNDEAGLLAALAGTILILLGVPMAACTFTCTASAIRSASSTGIPRSISM